jgi:hypothetical protein
VERLEVALSNKEEKIKKLKKAVKELQEEINQMMGFEDQSGLTQQHSMDPKLKRKLKMKLKGKSKSKELMQKWRMVTTSLLLLPSCSLHSLLLTHSHFVLCSLSLSSLPLALHIFLSPLALFSFG